MKALFYLLLIFSFSRLHAQTREVLSVGFDKIKKTETVNPLTRKGLSTPEINRDFYIIGRKNKVKGQIFGNFYKKVEGIKGNALQLDGNTSFVEADLSKDVEDSFSVGIWFALASFPTNWCPVAEQRTAKKGFFLGVDAYGHAGFKIFIGDDLIELRSDQKIPLREWTHIQGSYSPTDGLSLYLNGKLVAHQFQIEGKFNPANSEKLIIGKSTILQKPEGTIRPNATKAVSTFLDGLVDELHIYNTNLKISSIKRYYDATKPAEASVLANRLLPLSNAKPGEFGAVYTKLKYYESWDVLWPVGNAADVVINFDNNASKLVFWRGTSYIPHWITENGIWYNNEFLETWGKKGSYEPMSDKHCKYSHVRILENNDARVVIHWRYALVDNFDKIARMDSLTGFGEWADKIYTIYPDGIGVRKIILYSSQPQSAHEWQESIVVMGPGQRPEQVIEPTALTLVNMKGETYTYNWKNGIPKEADKYGHVKLPTNANIELINTKSSLRPFVIISPNADPIWDIYHGELRKEVSRFPWWNHWPAALKASDGRYAIAPDRASHSSLSHVNWSTYELKKNSQTKIMLNGLTPNKAEDLIPLTQSWVNPARLTLESVKGFTGGEYDPAQRAYMISSNGLSKF